VPNIIRHEKVFHRSRGYGFYEVDAPVVKCTCGEEVVCGHFTNTCTCRRDYNFAGQLLAPRSQWGEETGEHLSDILRTQ